MIPCKLLEQSMRGLPDLETITDHQIHDAFTLHEATGAPIMWVSMHFCLLTMHILDYLLTLHTHCIPFTAVVVQLRETRRSILELGLVA